MASAYVIWSRQDKQTVGPHGNVYLSSADASAAIRRLVGKSGEGPDGKKTYDVVTVTV